MSDDDEYYDDDDYFYIDDGPAAEAVGSLSISYGQPPMNKG